MGQPMDGYGFSLEPPHALIGRTAPDMELVPIAPDSTPMRLSSLTALGLPLVLVIYQGSHSPLHACTLLTVARALCGVQVIYSDC